MISGPSSPTDLISKVIQVINCNVCTVYVANMRVRPSKKAVYEGPHHHALFGTLKQFVDSFSLLYIPYKRLITRLIYAFLSLTCTLCFGYLSNLCFMPFERKMILFPFLFLSLFFCYLILYLNHPFTSLLHHLRL